MFNRAQICTFMQITEGHTKSSEAIRTVRLDEGGIELSHLLVRSVSLDAVLSHVAVHGDDLVLRRKGELVIADEV